MARLNQTNWLVILGVAAACVRPVYAEELVPSRFKSPLGRYDVVFESVDEKTAKLYQVQPADAGLKPKYLLYFYKPGVVEPVSSNWYTDATPPKSPSEIFGSMTWSPREDYVVLTRGQNSKEQGLGHWLLSLEKKVESRFEGAQAVWIDRDRLVNEVKTDRIRGGVQLVDAKGHKAELIVSPTRGIGYEIAASSGSRVTVREYLNHWGEEKEKATWEYFAPACFDLEILSMKKRSVPCPGDPGAGHVLSPAPSPR